MKWLLGTPALQARVVRATGVVKTGCPCGMPGIAQELAMDIGLLTALFGGDSCVAGVRLEIASKLTNAVSAGR